MRLIPNVEKHLVKGLRDGRKEAFDAVYEIYGKRLLAYCVGQVGCSEDAEDIVQEVFLSLWRTRSELKDVDSLRPLLFTSARNRIINLWKSRLNSNLYSDYIAEIREKDTASGSAGMEYREFERMVMKEIDKLPPTQRNVVRLSRMENLDTKEIAERLHLSVQTVKNALSTGLKSLRSALGGKTFVILLLILLSHLASES